MSPEAHPTWCSRSACTVGIDEFEQLHRSEPTLISTEDQAVHLVIYKLANPDGSDEYLAVAKLPHPAPEPWYLVEPVNGLELLLPRTSVSVTLAALAALA